MPGDRALVPHPVAGARAAVLLLGGPAQHRLQAGAGGHQPLPRRLQQPESGVPAAGVQAAMAAIEKICPEAKNLLLVPENHTRNTFYLQNVRAADADPHQAGLNVRIGTLNPEIKEPTELGAARRRARSPLEPLVRSKRRLGLKDFDPCTILLNNDLSAGIPGSWTTCTSRPAAAAARRLGGAPQDATTSSAYEDVAKKFAQAAGHRSVAHQPDVQPVRQDQLRRRHGRGVPAANVDALLDEDPPQVRGIRHQREAVRRSSRPTPAPTAWAS